MTSKQNSIVLLLCILTLWHCRKESNDLDIIANTQSEPTNSYAEGFKIFKDVDSQILEIKNPWPDSDRTYRYLLLTEEQFENNSINTASYDGVITIPVQSIVVTSTTHIPALELLNVDSTLIGFPGTDYISSPKTRSRIDQDEIRELGKNEGLNTEVLLEIDPDIVVGYGIDGNNKSLETVENSGIPVLYNGDWVEKSPLAKAEWIKFFGILFDKGDEANAIFEQIETDYLEAKLIASKVKNKPDVLCGAMHKDIWYLPNGTSPEAQILKDANVNYLWKDTQDQGSIALNFETVFEKARHADLWLSPSYYGSMEALAKANVHYTNFDPFKKNAIYSFANTTGETGGVLYYELGTARPDLVLKDIIKICHPELLQDYQTHFFKPLH